MYNAVYAVCVWFMNKTIMISLNDVNSTTLNLIFLPYLLKDLKKYFDSCGGQISMKTAQVCSLCCCIWL